MRVGTFSPKLLGTVTDGSSDLRKVAESAVASLLDGRDTTFIGSEPSFKRFRAEFLNVLFSNDKFNGVPRTSDFEGILADRHLKYFASYAESDAYPRRENIPVFGGMYVIENDEETVNSLSSRELIGELEIYHLVV